MASERATVTPSDEQVRALDLVGSGKNIFITGGAGVGKSEVLKLLRRRYPDLQVTSSTGISAVSVGGITIHSWSGIKLGREPAEEIVDRLYFSRDRSPVYDRILSAKRLALDEVSMISGTKLTLIDQVLRGVRNVDEPFGGLQMVFFGDFLQLPPVEDYSEDPELGRFAFESPSWRAADVQPVLLKKVFRQTQPEFIQALNEARMGYLSPAAMGVLATRYQVADPEPDKPPVRLFGLNADVDELNTRRLQELEGEETRYTAVDWFASDSIGRQGNELISKNCPAQLTLALKVGARVMLLKNLETPLGLANGSLGVVTKLGDVPTVQFDNDQVRQVQPQKWEIDVGGRVIASRLQLPLRLAWAWTIHKSQGSSLTKVRISLQDSFEFGQGYVALSRARTLDGLFIDDGGAASIFAHPAPVSYYQRIEHG